VGGNGAWLHVHAYLCNILTGTCSCSALGSACLHVRALALLYWLTALRASPTLSMLRSHGCWLRKPRRNCHQARRLSIPWPCDCTALFAGGALGPRGQAVFAFSLVPFGMLCWLCMRFICCCGPLHGGSTADCTHVLCLLLTRMTQHVCARVLFSGALSGQGCEMCTNHSRRAPRRCEQHVSEGARAISSKNLTAAGRIRHLFVSDGRWAGFDLAWGLQPQAACPPAMLGCVAKANATACSSQCRLPDE
jgi:hypothetical protein